MKDLSFRAPPLVAIAENATTPVGGLGSTIWSTISNKKLEWNGSAWVSSAGSSGGITAPATTVVGRVPVFNNTSGSSLGQSTLSLTESSGSSALESEFTQGELSLHLAPDIELNVNGYSSTQIGDDYKSSDSNLDFATVKDLGGYTYAGGTSDSLGYGCLPSGVTDSYVYTYKNWYAVVRVTGAPDPLAMANTFMGTETNETLSANAFFNLESRTASAGQTRLAFSSRSSGSAGVSSIDYLGGPLQLKTNNTVRYTFGLSGQLGIGTAPDYGTAGQVLTSGGPSAAPYWQTLPTGIGTGNVSGPATSIVNRIATFNSTDGTSIKQADFADLPDISVPAIPSAGTLRLFARSQANRMLPAFVGPSGLDSNLQPALFRNTTYMWLAGTGTTVAINWGTSWTARNSGTSAAQATPAKTSSSAITSMNRATFGTGTTATGSSGIQSTATVAWRGNAAGLGGFFFMARFGVETHQAAMQYIVGLSELNAALTGEPSAQNNTIAIGKDSTDSTWQLITRDGTNVTKTNTGATVTAGQILDLMIFAPPNASSVHFRLVNAVTGAVIVDDLEITTTLPASTVFMYAHAQCRSTSGTTAKLLALNRIYVECDL